MDRKEFLEKVASKIGADLKEVEMVFQKFLDEATTALRDGDKVNLSNFGTFSPRVTKATTKFSALLNREIEIPEKFTISFSPASKLAEEINSKYKDEKPTVIKQASEREIESRIPIISEENEVEEFSEEKFFDEVSSSEGKEVESIRQEPTVEDEISLSSELLEALKEVEERFTEESLKDQRLTSEVTKKEEIKEEVSKMPEMNLNQEKPKFSFGEDLTSSSVGSGSYTQSSSEGFTNTPGGYQTKEGSGALWVSLIILLIGIIGVGIYWALSTDVTETKKEPFTEIKKETTPPVLVEKQPPTAAKKQIIVAPEEFSTIPPDTVVKQKIPLLVEEPTVTKKDQKVVPEKTTQIKTTVEPQRQQLTTAKRVKPIQRKTAVKTNVVKSSAVSSLGEYYIQVNSYTNKRLAEAFARNLRNKGYRAFVEVANVSNYGTMYRVKVGFYNDEDAASKDYHALRLSLKKEDIYVDRR